MQFINPDGTTIIGVGIPNIEVHAPMVEFDDDPTKFSRPGYFGDWVLADVMDGPSENSEFVMGDGLNRLNGIGAGDFQLANAMVDSTSDTGPVSSDAPVLVLSAKDDKCEHYGVLSWQGEMVGSYVFSTAVRLGPGAGVRLQLLDTKANGVILDFAPSAGEQPRIERIGRSRSLRYMVLDAKDGWFRIWIAARLEAAQGTVVVQFINPDGTTIIGVGIPNIEVHAPMVEFGDDPTKFSRPGYFGDWVLADVMDGPSENSEFVMGDGLNRLNGIGAGDFQLANAMVDSTSDTGPVSSDAPVLVLSAKDDKCEHYGVLSWQGEMVGSYVFSTAVRLGPGAGVRLQLLDTKANGVILDFAPSAGEQPRIERIGRSRSLRYMVLDAKDGWFRIWIAARLEAAQGTVVVQFINPDGTTIIGVGIPNIEVHAPMVEFGDDPTKFSRPEFC